MKWLILIVLVGACEENPSKAQVEELVDQKCKAYLAVPGEPCKDGYWLYIDDLRNFPRPAVCACDVKQIAK